MSYDSIFKYIFFLLIITFVSKFIFAKEPFQKDTSKSIIGEYFSPRQDFNKFTSESLVLKSDSMFEYSINTEFTKIIAKGRWYVSAGKLILNSEKKKSKINVDEKLIKNNDNRLSFHVTYKDDDPMNYQLYLITTKGTLHYKDMFQDTVINFHQTLKAFYIVDARGFRYPTYFIEKGKSNCFSVKLELDRIFDNEKWLIKSKGLQPIGLDGKYANYYLAKGNR